MAAQILVLLYRNIFPSESVVQVSIGNFTQILSFYTPKMRLWAPKPAPEPSPGLPQLRDTPRHSGAGPETPCFASSFRPDPLFSSALSTLVCFRVSPNLCAFISLNAVAAAPQVATMVAAGSRWPARRHRVWAQAGARLPAGVPAGNRNCRCRPLCQNGSIVWILRPGTGKSSISNQNPFKKYRC